MKGRWLIWAVVAVISWGIWAFLSKLLGEALTAAQSQALSSLGLLPIFALLVISRKLTGIANRRGAVWAFTAGVLGCLGNLAYYHALNLGGKAVTVAPLTALYPLVTVGLAVVLLKEKLNRIQLIGISLSLVAIYLFNVPSGSGLVSTWLLFALLLILVWGLAGLLQKIEDKLGRNGSFPIDPSVIPQPTSGRGDFNNFGPRVGVAWDPKNNGVMNIHAAYGMFYDNMRTLQNFGELTWPQSQTVIINRPSYPDPYQGQSRNQFVSTAPPNISVMSNATVNPYAQQFDIGVNRIVAREYAVSVDWSYVNRYSDRDTVDPNLPIPNIDTGTRPYPQFNRVSFWQSTSDNTYRALLVKVEKRMSNRYQFLTSYTLSSAKDQGFTNSLGDRYGYFKVDRYGVADRRHRLVVSGIVQLPWMAQISAIGDFRSSLPFGISSALGDINRDGYTGDLPAGVLPNTGCRGLNLDAINAIRAGRNLTQVTQVDCPGFANVDLRFSKFFTIARAHQIEFIAQLFNIFNRANFAAPNGSITAGNDTTGRPLFGQSQSLLANINAPSRQAEFAVRWKF